MRSLIQPSKVGSMPGIAVNNKYERVFQIYCWFKTARLNVLYYEESLRRWTCAVRIHDLVIAFTGASSPIAYWRHSSAPLHQQAWFYLTILAGFSSMLKPIFRWDKQLVLFSELQTHYSDLYLDLKILCEDIAATGELTSKLNERFEHCRETFKMLERKEPPPDEARIHRLQAKVNLEININHCWFPAQLEEQNDR